MEVRVYRKRRGVVEAARRLLRATASDQHLGGGREGIAAGCFLPPAVDVEDPTVVVMLFSLEDLGREVVVHECYHAGWRMARFLGHPSSDDGFDTVRELREWLDEHQVSGDAKIRVWLRGGSVGPLVLGQLGASRVVAQVEDTQAALAQVG